LYIYLLFFLQKTTAKPTTNDAVEEESSVKLIGAACNFHKPGTLTI